MIELFIDPVKTFSAPPTPVCLGTLKLLHCLIMSLTVTVALYCSVVVLANGSMKGVNIGGVNINSLRYADDKSYLQKVLCFYKLY